MGRDADADAEAVFSAERFSPRQRTTMRIGIAVMVGMVLYPPWVLDLGESRRSSWKHQVGYHWIWSPPQPSSDWSFAQGRQVVICWSQVGVMASLVALGVFLLLVAQERLPSRGVRAGAEERASSASRGSGP